MIPDLHIFKSQIGMFDPVALQDQNVRIRYIQSVHYRRVDFLESIPPHQCIDITAGSGLAAGVGTARINLTNLEMAKGEFGLFRWYPLDDAQIRLFHPAGISKFQLMNIQVPLDKSILGRDPNLVSTEIVVWQENRPAMEAINAQAFALGAVRIIAMGYRFHTIDLEQGKYADPELVKALKAKKEPCTDIWCSGRALGD